MRWFYSGLFYSIYLFFKYIDRYGYSYQTTETRTFTTVIVLSVFVLLNVMTIFPDKIVRDQVIVPSILIALLNFALFYINKNYAKIVLSYQERPLSTTAKIMALSYVIVTIVAFALTR